MQVSSVPICYPVEFWKIREKDTKNENWECVSVAAGTDFDEIDGVTMKMAGLEIIFRKDNHNVFFDSEVTENKNPEQGSVKKIEENLLDIMLRQARQILVPMN